jgi:hypothetical protein
MQTVDGRKTKLGCMSREQAGGNFFTTGMG